MQREGCKTVEPEATNILKAHHPPLLTRLYDYFYEGTFAALCEGKLCWNVKLATVACWQWCLCLTVVHSSYILDMQILLILHLHLLFHFPLLLLVLFHFLLCLLPYIT